MGRFSPFYLEFQDGWTPLHCSAQAGHLSVVKLLVESGSSTTAETSNGRVPLWFAASENKLKVVTYLIQQEHDSYKLLDDRKVLNPKVEVKKYYTHMKRFTLCHKFITVCTRGI